MKYPISEFNSFVNGIQYKTSTILYATNTVRILFLSESNEKLYFFHVDPPWRISLNGKIITNSYNYPNHENYSDNQRKEEEEDFRVWCAKTDFMRSEPIRRIIVEDNADLTVEWKNGAILNAFVNDIEDPSYYFYDKVNNKVYEFMYGDCIQDALKQTSRR